MSYHAPTFPLRPRFRRLGAILALGAALSLSACNSDDNDDGGETPNDPPVSSVPATAELALLTTTDLHANVLGFDYYKLSDDKSYGFAQTATVIREARGEFANTLLVDNGDTIQGTALSDYEAQVDRIACDQPLSIFKAMGELGYDAGTLGNHEFNYGLMFLEQALGGKGSLGDIDGIDLDATHTRCEGQTPGAGYAMTLANVKSAKTGETLVPAYQILDRTIKATNENGDAVDLPIKIGLVGLTTPGIMNWDKRWLDGNVTVEDGVETARKIVPEVRAQGADLVFVLLHGGLSDAGYSANMENPGLYVADIAGIDGIVMGHQHNRFPDRGDSPAYTYEGVDNTAGTVKGIPAVMAGQWGQALGVIDYSLQWDGAEWSIDTSKTEVALRNVTSQDADGGNVYVETDTAVAAAVAQQHEATVAYVEEPIGQSDFRMSTFFADVGDPGAIQLVNQAQQAYVTQYVADNLPEYKDVPVLSISAPFKSGYGSGSDYTDVQEGGVAIFNAADLYLYPNTVYAVKVDGRELKLWLENAALRFNKIDPSATADQWLIKDTRTGQVPDGKSAFAGYNFDVFTDTDISYEIDVTRDEGDRIKNLTYQGVAVTEDQAFIVATNNYRAESSAPYILGQGKSFDIIYASPDANRDVVIQYIKDHPEITRSDNGSARSWRFSPVASLQGKVLFKSSKDATVAMAQEAGLDNIALDSASDGGSDGRAVFRIDLSRP